MNTAGQLGVGDADSSRLFSSNRRPEFCRCWSLNEINTTCPKQRHDLLPTIRRRIRRDDGENQSALFSGHSNLLHADDDRPSSQTKPDQSEHALGNGSLHRNC